MYHRHCHMSSWGMPLKKKIVTAVCMLACMCITCVFRNREVHSFSVMRTAWLHCEWLVCGQEPFVRDCASFLVVRCPQLVGKDDQTTQSKSHQLPAETIGTVLACLQACCSYVFNNTLMPTLLVCFLAVLGDTW